jgi:hypothetical protein
MDEGWINKAIEVRAEPFGRVAFYVAIAVMVLPIQGDILFSLLHDRRIGTAKVVWTLCFMVVFVPFCISLCRLFQRPERWRGRGTLIFTGCVLVYDIVGAISFFGVRYAV